VDVPQPGEGVHFNSGSGCVTRSHMELTPTLWLLGSAVAVAIFAGWRGARPPNLIRGPRLMPWRLLMVTAAALALVMLVHTVNLLGVHTGR